MLPCSIMWPWDLHDISFFEVLFYAACSTLKHCSEGQLRPSAMNEGPPPAVSTCDTWKRSKFSGSSMLDFHARGTRFFCFFWWILHMNLHIDRSRQIQSRFLCSSNSYTSRRSIRILIHEFQVHDVYDEHPKAKRLGTDQAHWPCWRNGSHEKSEGLLLFSKCPQFSTLRKRVDLDEFVVGRHLKNSTCSNVQPGVCIIGTFSH